MSQSQTQVGTNEVPEARHFPNLCTNETWECSPNQWHFLLSIPHHVELVFHVQGPIDAVIQEAVAMTEVLKQNTNVERPMLRITNG